MGCNGFVSKLKKFECFVNKIDLPLVLFRISRSEADPSSKGYELFQITQREAEAKQMLHREPILDGIA